eukprot:CAMPEP_0181300936 /NCGR_PEP_ID=MMETSP1101-20121128/7157_1 /TAXON_ID=46948 /ORGANISM="Rhodomonas abbreviata, Strain Caron Lab Isolate" /LENGTH=824 /DNA_ID=CAMNT_0023406209 /DNA_START=28 /DNA_END=2498 /DNA_ORIENTATION=+
MAVTDNQDWNQCFDEGRDASLSDLYNVDFSDDAQLLEREMSEQMRQMGVGPSPSSPSDTTTLSRQPTPPLSAGQRRGREDEDETTDDDGDVTGKRQREDPKVPFLRLPYPPRGRQRKNFFDDYKKWPWVPVGELQWYSRPILLSNKRDHVNSPCACKFGSHHSLYNSRDNTFRYYEVEPGQFWVAVAQCANPKCHKMRFWCPVCDTYQSPKCRSDLTEHPDRNNLHKRNFKSLCSPAPEAPENKCACLMLYCPGNGSEHNWQQHIERLRDILSQRIQGNAPACACEAAGAPAPAALSMQAMEHDHTRSTTSDSKLTFVMLILARVIKAYLEARAAQPGCGNGWSMRLLGTEGEDQQSQSQLEQRWDAGIEEAFACEMQGMRLCSPSTKEKGLAAILDLILSNDRGNLLAVLGVAEGEEAELFTSGDGVVDVVFYDVWQRLGSLKYVSSFQRELWRKECCFVPDNEEAAPAPAPALAPAASTGDGGPVGLEALVGLDGDTLMGSFDIEKELGIELEREHTGSVLNDMLLDMSTPKATGKVDFEMLIKQEEDEVSGDAAAGICDSWNRSRNSGSGSNRVSWSKVGEMFNNSNFGGEQMAGVGMDLAQRQQTAVHLRDLRLSKANELLEASFHYAACPCTCKITGSYVLVMRSSPLFVFLLGLQLQFDPLLPPLLSNLSASKSPLESRPGGTDGRRDGERGGKGMGAGYVLWASSVVGGEKPVSLTHSRDNSTAAAEDEEEDEEEEEVDQQQQQPCTFSSVIDGAATVMARYFQVHAPSSHSSPRSLTHCLAASNALAALPTAVWEDEGERESDEVCRLVLHREGEG